MQTEFEKYEQALFKNTVEELLPIMPMRSMLFSPALRSIHERLVTTRPLPYTFIVPCLSGFSRRFCDIVGNYYPCERVDSSKRYLLGNVWNGLDGPLFPTEKREGTRWILRERFEHHSRQGMAPHGGRNNVRYSSFGLEFFIKSSKRNSSKLAYS